MNYINPMTLLRLLIYIITCNVMMATTITVDQSGSGNHTTISGAISAASSDDTIKVNSGYYIENFTINKTLVIIGSGYSNTTIYSGNTVIHANSDLQISGFTIESSSNTSFYSYSSLKLSNCIVKSSESALYLEGGSANIINCVFKDSNVGIRVGGNYSATASIINCVFDETNYGVSQWHGSSVIQNSIFYNNNNYAIYKESSSAAVTSVFNIYYLNSPPFYNVSFGTGDLTSNPQFNDLSAGYTINTSSPCIDTGNPAANYNDTDGSRNNMGVYGGPYSWAGSGPATTNLQISPAAVNQGQTITIQATGTVQ